MPLARVWHTPSLVLSMWLTLPWSYEAQSQTTFCSAHAPRKKIQKMTFKFILLCTDVPFTGLSRAMKPKVRGRIFESWFSSSFHSHLNLFSTYTNKEFHKRAESWLIEWAVWLWVSHITSLTQFHHFSNKRLGNALRWVHNLHNKVTALSHSTKRSRYFVNLRFVISCIHQQSLG